MAELATYLDVNEMMVHRWETGKSVPAVGDGLRWERALREFELRSERRIAEAKGGA